MRNKSKRCRIRSVERRIPRFAVRRLADSYSVFDANERLIESQRGNKCLVVIFAHLWQRRGPQSYGLIHTPLEPDY